MNLLWFSLLINQTRKVNTLVVGETLSVTIVSNERLSRAGADADAGADEMGEADGDGRSEGQGKMDAEGLGDGRGCVAGV
jgi:hypothetical protein